jgi:RNA polymerase-binding transcription factor DksA
MAYQERTSRAAMTGADPGPGPRSGPGAGPRWRALLEARWQARLGEVTELSLAYHVAAAAIPAARADGSGYRAGALEAEALLRRAVAARRKLADVEEALARLTAGRFGRCEQCGSAIPDGLLAMAPETRYCSRCDAAPVDAGAVDAGPAETGPARGRPLAERLPR